MCASPASDRLLHTAADLFYRRGIRAVGVDTVVAESSVAKMTLYKHFPSKDSLVVAALEQQGGIWREWFEEAVTTASEAPLDRILAIFDVLGHWFATAGFQGCALLNAAVELRDQAHPAWTVVHEHKAWLRAFVRRLVDAAGLSEPECSTDALFLLIEGAIVGAQLGVAEQPAKTAKCTAGLVLSARAPALSAVPNPTSATANPARRRRSR